MIKRTLIATLAGGALLSAAGAQTAGASYLVTFSQDGPNVVASGSGSIDLADLSPTVLVVLGPSVTAADGEEFTGPLSALVTLYGSVSGPSSFGPISIGFPANTGSGDEVGVFGASSEIAVPLGYVSGAPLSDTATYAGQTLASLGLTPGTYVYTWGSGPTADTFTVQIGSSVRPIPEPESLLLLSAGLIGLGLVRATKRTGAAGVCLRIRRLSKRNALSPKPALPETRIAC